MRANTGNETKYFLLTVDVEDWFQVENFKPWIPFSSWDQRELRVERNVHRLLDLFDSLEFQQREEGGAYGAEDLCHRRIASSQFLPEIEKATESNQSCKSCQQKINSTNSNNSINCKKKKVKATFFTLAWIAEKLPHLVREMHARGHEVASHGCNHELPDKIPLKDLQRDLAKSKEKLEDIIGDPVHGFRAPSFAVNNDTLKTIQNSGYRYDSSYNSFNLHGRYGQISLNGSGKKGIAHKFSDNFYELPISNLMINRRVIPWGGGGYFRLTPYRLFRLGVQTILKKDAAFLFYAHPWEFDPEQPKVKQASFSFKFRHYHNLKNTYSRLAKLAKSFKECNFITCSDYIKAKGI